MIEPSSAVTAAPARASLTGVAPSRPSEPRAYTTTGGEGGAGEGEPHVAEQRRQAEAVDADDDEQGGAGVDAEDAGIGQRVAGEALHDRAADAERGAGEQADDGAGDAQRADDQVVVVRRVEVEQGVDHRRRAGSTWRRRRCSARQTRHEHADGERRGRRRGRCAGVADAAGAGAGPSPSRGRARSSGGQGLRAAAMNPQNSSRLTCQVSPTRCDACPSWAWYAGWPANVTSYVMAARVAGDHDGGRARARCRRRPGRPCV